MTFSINYKKRKNTHLFAKFQNNKDIQLTNSQNYIPIYDKFFSLNQTNYNSINLNHKWYINDIKIDDINKNKKKNKNDNKEDNNICKDPVNTFVCKLKHCDDENKCVNQKVFFKMAPLLDPFKYIAGKYNLDDTNLFNLPQHNSLKEQLVHPKILDTNNSSYVDGFFSFLGSHLLNNHNVINCVDYYGSFIGLKQNFKINIIDDLEYLVESQAFNQNKNILFTVDDYSHLFVDIDENKKLPPLTFSSSLKSVLSIKSINNDLFEDLFDKSSNNNDLISNNNLIDDNNLVDLTDSADFQYYTNKEQKSDTLKSGSDCSSRTSHTDDDSEIDMDEQNDCIEYTSIGSKKSTEKEKDDDSVWEEITNDNSTFIDDDEQIWLTIPTFPVQVICSEHCEGTFDELIVSDDLSEEECLAALCQVIMTLIIFQNSFSFTHNDLHSNNIMYTTTYEKYIYYKFKNIIYKVPTFGKIYKIIDFGRAIYKFNGKLFCSDSFQIGGDAATQYNTEPYFNEKKPRLEPNFSFDLCRLACSIFDHIVDDFDTTKKLETCSPLQKIITEWCIDDNGINVLYKANGIERYPDFKLYKMIARHVHKHTPHTQLERQEFKEYIFKSSSKLPKGCIYIDIDSIPSYI